MTEEERKRRRNLALLLFQNQPDRGIWRWLIEHKSPASLVPKAASTPGIPERKVKKMDVWPLQDYDRYAIWTVLRIAGYTHHVRVAGKIEEVRLDGDLLIRNTPEVVEGFGVGMIVACRRPDELLKAVEQ